jgi:hypothetical protein
MLRVGSSFVVFTLAACGGSVADVPASRDPAQRTTAPDPESPATGAPPTGTAPRPPSTSPAGPLPSGPISSCGLLEGDKTSNLTAFGRAGALATYGVVAVVEECSGAGGLHVTLQRRSGCATASVVHFGGHACHGETWAVGDRAVVGVAPEAGSVKDPGWCLEGVAAWDGVARAIWKLAPGANESEILSSFDCAP